MKCIKIEIKNKNAFCDTEITYSGSKNDIESMLANCIVDDPQFSDYITNAVNKAKQIIKNKENK